MRERVTKKRLCQLAFLKLMRENKLDAALELSNQLIQQDMDKAESLYIRGNEHTIAIIDAINSILDDGQNLEFEGRMNTGGYWLRRIELTIIINRDNI